MKKQLNKYGIIHQGFSPVSIGAQEKIEGVLIQKFKKDMIKVGFYKHPTAGWELDATPEKLEQYLNAFNTMRANGVDVEIPIDHSTSAAANLGYVTDMFIEPDEDGVPTLYGIHEARGEHAIDVIARNKNVSIYIEKNFVDGKGNEYGEAIVHSSVVQGPIVPGQGEFIPIAASKDGGKIEQIPVFNLCEGDKTMDKEMLLKLKALLGKDDDSTEENVLSRIEAAMKASADSLTTAKDESIKLKKEVEKIKAASTQTASTEVKIDPNLAEQMGSTAEQQLSLLVQAGKITPAVKDKLSAGLIGETGKRNLIALSLGENSSPSVLSVVVDALQDNDIVKLGEQTGAQVMQRTVPADDKGEGTKADKESGDVMMSAAGVSEKKKD